VWFGSPDGEGGFSLDRGAAERRERLLPPEVACPSCGRRESLTLQDVIVDVWFESGVSHEAVLGRPHQPPWPSDLYLEGHDQYRGWFQSSLLVSVEGHERAPFGTVLTHGFTLTQNAETGRTEKMSKSLGNAISPVDVARERGAEILRLWVSQVDFLEDMVLSDEILARNTEAYRKIRNTFRFLLGNLAGFDPAADRVPDGELLEIDAWILGRFEDLRRRLVAAYERYELHRVYHGLHQFCGVTLSSFYLDVLKDRLYTSPPASRERRSAHTALYLLADGLCRLMAPIACFTAEEVWRHLPGDPEARARSVHETLFPEALPHALDESRDERWAALLSLRDEVARALEQARRAKLINDSLEAVVRLDLPDGLRPVVEHFGGDLRFLLKVAEVGEGEPGPEALTSETHSGLRVGILRSEGSKCPRCWNRENELGTDAGYPEVCARCASALRSILGGEGAGA
jgi:isoleucyl-tRNA synthetase